MPDATGFKGESFIVISNFITMINLQVQRRWLHKFSTFAEPFDQKIYGAASCSTLKAIISSGRDPATPK
jgi:hypothetical protein